MTIDSDDLHIAATTVARAISDSLAGPDVNTLHSEAGRGTTSRRAVRRRRSHREAR